MIELRDVSKIYQIGDERVHALDHANLHVYPKEFVSIIGPSGSGKSTLMNIIGCLDVADGGQYLLDGMPIEAYSENELANVRNRKIGFVFQSFNLIAKLSAQENVELCLVSSCLRRILWQMYMSMMRGILEWIHMKRRLCLVLRF